MLAAASRSLIKSRRQELFEYVNFLDAVLMEEGGESMCEGSPW